MRASRDFKNIIGWDMTTDLYDVYKLYTNSNSKQRTVGTHKKELNLIRRAEHENVLVP